jgi:predicted nucleotidyltransferase
MGILGRHDAYSKMVQFRNFLVHRYERVDNEILVDMVNHRLVDFEGFVMKFWLMSGGQSMSINWQLITDCMSHSRNVVAAWIFGSAQGGTVRPGGDIDVGVLFYKKPLFDELADLRICLQNAFVFDDIDLAVLNDASPTLRFEAVSGRPVYVADMERRASFTSLTAREYEDEMAQWRLALAA